MEKLIFFFLLFILTSDALSFSGKGSGTKDDPYQITNIYQLQEIQKDYVAYYILMNDINATDTRNWNYGDHDRDSLTPDQPMGFKPLIFGGNLNGDGYIIDNLFINRPCEPYVGFIGDMSGKIIKLGLEDCNVKGECQVGSICGYLIHGTIEECYTTGIVEGSDAWWGCSTGGFFGDIFSSIIKNCYSTCIVSSFTQLYRGKIYGFCGGSKYSFNNFFNCYFAGRISRGYNIFGEINNAQNSFWDIETMGLADPQQPDSNFAKGLPTAEMMKRTTFENAGWDFDSVWCIEEGIDYPILRAFRKCNPVYINQESKLVGELLIIYPNPASNECTISFSEPGLCRKFQVFNCFGEDVTSAILNTKINDNNIKLDVSTLSGGVYFVVLDLNGRHFSKPFVVVR